MSNRLSAETSPYLLQHAENPVDWFPWGQEAFDLARSQDKPVFLSVGYSACHWCHVMEHESFENGETAAFLNEHFVSVKVDREERPDIDAIYMDVLVALEGRGGWPMSVFLTPDAEPFYAGTYFPDTPRFGSPAFIGVLRQIVELWNTRRDDLLDVSASLKNQLVRQAVSSEEQPPPLDPETLVTAMTTLTQQADRVNGGWGTAPKFPQPAVLEFVLRRFLAAGDQAHMELATRTLDAMMNGGIYDQVGGGFHRYATDEIWLVPHFEKMLYDNAQLARVYLHAWQITRNDRYRGVVTETLDYLAREMLDPSGGFYSAQDADTEGVEGRFFVWTPEEIRSAFANAPDVTAEDAELFIEAYGVTDEGNFEGSNILSVATTHAELATARGADVAQIEATLARGRQALLSARDARVRPGVDDKVITSWNGLALAAFAEAARVLGRDDYRAIAEKNAEFVLAEVRDADGRMRRTWKGGQAKLNGYLEDYAHYADGLLELYQTTFEPTWFVAARGLADVILEHFSDRDGGYFDVSDDHERLLVRPKGLEDGATPSGGSMAAGVLARLAELTGEGRYANSSEAALARVQGIMTQLPLGFAQWLSVLDFVLSPPREVAIVGEDVSPLLDFLREQYRPNVLVASGEGGGRTSVPLLEGREAEDGQATAFVCREQICERPVTRTEELEALLA